MELTNKKLLEEFLQEFSKLEVLLRQDEDLPPTMSVLEYESLLEPLQAEKLKLCRIIRNYCRHHDDYRSFAAVSEEMLRFLQRLCSNLESKYLHISDKTIKVTPVSDSSTLAEIAVALGKSKVGFVPILEKSKTDEDIIGGVIDEKVFLGLVNANETASLKTKLIKVRYLKGIKFPEFTYANLGDLYEEHIGEKYIIVMKDGKYRGIAS